MSKTQRIISISISTALVAAVVFYFLRVPPIKYWTNNPTNFEECKEATRGFIIKTLPAQCEFRGKNFIDQSRGQVGILNSPSRQSESEIVSSLKTNWELTQTLIPFRPVYHNQNENAKKVWRAPGAMQFIGKDRMFVRFEDDNNVHVAVFGLDGDEFNLAEIFKNQSEFPFSVWQDLVNKYGDTSYPVGTYTKDMVRNGQIVTFPDLTKVPENIFVKD